MSAPALLRLEIPLAPDCAASRAEVARLLRLAADALESSGEPGVVYGDGYGYLLSRRDVSGGVGYWSGDVAGEWAIQPRG